MATMVNELYDALLAAGVEEPAARKAAQTVIGVQEKDTLATKSDIRELHALIRGELHEMRSVLIVWTIGTLFTALGVWSAIMIAMFRSFSR